MGRRTPTFYVLHGSDEFSLRQQVRSLRAAMGDPATAEMNTSVLDGKNTSAAQVLSAARAMPFLSDKRLVIVEGMLSWLARKGAGKTGKAELEELAAGLEDLPPHARIVFVETDTLSDKHPIVVAAKTLPGGFHKLFGPPPNLAAWIRGHAREVYGVDVEPQAAAALAAIIDNDLRAADNEIAKLATYVNGERPITVEDLKLLTTYAAEPDVFEMVDAIGRRDGQTAIRLMHRLLAQDDPLRLFGMIVRQFRLLILAREHLNAGGAPGSLGQAIGVHPFVAKKLSEQVRAFSMEQLDAIYHHLLDTDLGIKTGKVDGALALDLLIAGIAN
jgi:DNA polymerase-3 subunit delta